MSLYIFFSSSGLSVYSSRLRVGFGEGDMLSRTTMKFKDHDFDGREGGREGTSRE